MNSTIGSNLHNGVYIKVPIFSVFSGLYLSVLGLNTEINRLIWTLLRQWVTSRPANPI